MPGGIWRIGIRRAVHGYPSELIYSLLPVFMVATWALPWSPVGIIASWRKSKHLVQSLDLFDGLWSFKNFATVELNGEQYEMWDATKLKAYSCEMRGKYAHGNIGLSHRLNNPF